MWSRLIDARDALGQDLRFAARYLARDRAFTVPVVLVLALGIGVGHMFFTLTYAHVVRGLPIEQVERVLSLTTIDARGTERGLSFPDFLDLRAAQRRFADLAAYTNAPLTLGDEGQVADRVTGTFATASGFAMAGVRAVAGRLFSAPDDRPGAPPTVVLTERVWRSRYHGDAGVIGRDVLVNGAPATVIGAVSDRSGFPSGAGVFLPLAALPELTRLARDVRTLQVFGRLANGASRAAAAADLDALAGTLASQFPATNAGVRIMADPINYRLLGGAGSIRGFLPFLAAGLIVLAVAGGNAGNLLLVGAAARAREVAVRTALGASRARIARQLLVESLLVAGLAAATGLLLSRAGVGVYRQWIPDGVLPYWFDYSLNPPLVAALSAMALATLVVFAVLPALHASRTTVVEVLKDGGRADTGRRLTGIGGSAFLGLQLGLAIVLVAQVGLASLTSDPPLATDSNLDSPRVLTGTVTLPTTRYATPEARRLFLTQLVDRLRALPGVVDVALASHGPVAGSFERRLTIEGQPADAPTSATTVRVVEVSAGYFAALDVGVVRGRDFDRDRGAPEASAALVNERFAALYGADGDAMGLRLAVAGPAAAGPPQWQTVVGVVPNIRQGLGRPDMPIVYAPLLAGSPANATLFVRSTGDGVSLVGAVRESLRQLDGLVPLDRARSLALATRDATWSRRVSSTLANTVCVSAFMLAVAGLYAVVAHRTRRRRREIGLRVALGADAIHVARLVVGTVRGALGFGLGLGLLGVVAWNRLFAPAGPGARGVSLAGVAAVVGVLVLTVAVGCLLPARRAARIAPGEALRHE